MNRRTALRWITTALGVLGLMFLERLFDETANQLGFSQWFSQILEGDVGGRYLTWALCVVAFLIGGSAFLWLDYWFRDRETIVVPRISKIVETIEGKTFLNTEVRLDGKKYDNCTFENVTFLYNGGPLEFTNNKINRSYLFRSEVQEINEFAALLFEMGIVKKAIGESGSLTPSSKFNQ